ncbi:MAG: enoyl-CoA hydratase-related protein [Marmoricola sp.]
MLVRTEYDDAIATITLDSPANRNALSKQLVTELIDALQATAQSAAKVVVIGSSQRVFCSGADLSEAAEGGMAQGAAALVEIQRLILAHPLPIVVRLDGPVRGLAGWGSWLPPTS